MSWLNWAPETGQPTVHWSLGTECDATQDPQRPCIIQSDILLSNIFHIFRSSPLCQLCFCISMFYILFTYYILIKCHCKIFLHIFEYAIVTTSLLNHSYPR